MHRKSLVRAALIPRAATVWSVQPQEQHHAQNDQSDDVETDNEDTDDDNSESVDDSEEDSDNESRDDSDESDDDSEEDKKLGPEGEKALKAEKEKRRNGAIKLRAAASRIKELEAQLAAGGDEESAERQRIESEAQSRANTRIVKAELKAAAAGQLLDPSDAIVFITDLEQFDVDEDGDVDADALAEAIADLIERKPHLAAQRDEKKKTPKPDRSQGARGTGSKSIADQFAAALGPTF